MSDRGADGAGVHQHSRTGSLASQQLRYFGESAVEALVVCSG
ncbi:hypothetical protein [Nocardia abscessus]|nr:hypothetical protein [Nocardia abscessus]